MPPSETRAEGFQQGAFESRRKPALGYLCRGFPPAVAAGLGLRPFRPARLLDGEMSRLGGELVRPDVCPAVKGVLGGALQQEGPLSRVSAWAGLATCDGTRRLFGELERLAGCPVIPLYLPSTRTREAEEYYARQIEVFVETAIRRGISSGWDAAAAGEFEAAYRRTAGLLREASLSGRAEPLTLSRLLARLSTADPIAEEANLAAAAQETLKEGRTPSGTVAVLEVPCTSRDNIFAEAIASRGMGMAALGCGALWGIPKDPPSKEPSPAELAHQYFKAVCCARSRPNEGVFERLLEELDTSGSSGLVVGTMRFCDLWFTERLRLRREMPVPVLVLDRDLSRSSRETAINRLDAFLDSLEAR